MTLGKSRIRFILYLLAIIVLIIIPIACGGSGNNSGGSDDENEEGEGNVGSNVWNATNGPNGGITRGASLRMVITKNRPITIEAYVAGVRSVFYRASSAVDWTVCDSTGLPNKAIQVFSTLFGAVGDDDALYAGMSFLGNSPEVIAGNANFERFYVSVDNGNTWTNRTFGAAPTGFDTYDFSALYSLSGRVYVAVNNNNGTGAALFYSENINSNAPTWLEKDISVTNTGGATGINRIYSVIANNANPLIVYIGTNNGVWRTNQVNVNIPGSNADDFQRVYGSDSGTPDDKVNDIGLNVAQEPVLVGTDNGLYYDSGSGHTKVAFDGSAISYIRFDPNTEQKLYVVQNDINLQYTENINDLGVNPFTAQDEGVGTANRMNGMAVFIDVEGSNDARYRCSNLQGVFYSYGDPTITREGPTFAQNNEGLRNIYCVRLLVSSSNQNTVYAATLTGVYFTTDGGITWAKVTGSDTEGDEAIYGIAEDTVNNLIYAGNSAGKLYSFNLDGTGWTLQRQFGTSINDIEVGTQTSIDYIYVATSASGVQRSELPLGGGFTEITNGDVASANVADMALDSTNEYLFISANSGTYKSANANANAVGAISWNNISPTGFTGRPASIAAGGVRANAIVVIGYSSGNGATEGVSISTTSGISWEPQQNAGLSNDASKRVRNIDLFQSNTQVIMIATDDGVYLTENRGQSWQTRKVGLEDVISAVAFFSGNSSVGYCSPSARGVYKNTALRSN